MRKGIGAVIILLFFACGRAPQTHYYTLDLGPPKRMEAMFRHPLWVQPFTSAPQYQQDRLLYRTGLYEVQFDHYRRWVSSPGDMLRGQIVRYLRALGLFQQVQITPPQQQTYYTLSGEILQFEEFVSRERRVANVRLWIEWYRSDRQEALYRGAVAGTAPIGNGGGEAIVSAMNEATAAALCNLFTRWQSTNPDTAAAGRVGESGQK